MRSRQAPRWTASASSPEGREGEHLQNGIASNPSGHLHLRYPGVSSRQVHRADHRDAYKALATRLERRARAALAVHDRIDGVHHLDRSRHRTRRSPTPRTATPATYTRCLLADPRLVRHNCRIDDARPQSVPLSFNVNGGRCDACPGDGMIKIEMHFPCRMSRAVESQMPALTPETPMVVRSVRSPACWMTSTRREFFKAVPVIRDKLLTFSRSPR